MTVPGVPAPTLSAPSVVPGIVACQSPELMARTWTSASSSATCVPDVVEYPFLGTGPMRVILGEASERGMAYWRAAEVRMCSRAEESDGMELSADGASSRRSSGSEREESVTRDEIGRKTLGRPEVRTETVTCERRCSAVSYSLARRVALRNEADLHSPRCRPQA